MKLIEKNIDRVIVKTMNKIPYCYFVVMKSGWVSDSRQFINVVNGRTTADYYDKSRLPKAVRQFIDKRTARERILSGIDIDGFKEYVFE